VKKSQRKEWYIPSAEKFVTTNNSATMKGVRSADEIEAAVGKSGGMLVRAHVDHGETRVYFAGPESASAGVLLNLATTVDAESHLLKLVRYMPRFISFVIFRVVCRTHRSALMQTDCCAKNEPVHYAALPSRCGAVLLDLPPVLRRQRLQARRERLIG
jgi:hypothetical protein